MKFLSMLIMSAALCGAMIFGYTWYMEPAVPTFHIKEITTLTEAGQCAAEGGKAMLIADMDTSGNIISDWVAGCILEAK